MAYFNTLCIFERLKSDPLIRRLGALQEAIATKSGVAEAAAGLCAVLYPEGIDLTEAVLSRALLDDNFYIRARAAKQTPDSLIEDSLKRELACLGEAAALNAEQLREAFGLTDMPLWKSAPRDFYAAYLRAAENASARGFGLFARYHVFRVDASAALQPVKNPDPQRLCDLSGYEAEREKVVQNTRALLSGAANNVLLYGDAGTGKSSTVKAIVNEFAPMGLRCIQLEKEQLASIPALLDTLADNPLAFIIFIDDLSFSEDDKDFTALKTLLEGSVAARPRNVAVYATSNRRHLIRESFSSRQGDEVHLADTLEESASLSARFGLVVTFSKPDKALYLDIVRSLVNAVGMEAGPSLLSRAEAYAIRQGGRTPRAARQFVEGELAISRQGIMS